MNLFDINGGEFLIIVALAILLIGPERLPHYAAQLGRLVRRIRSFAVDAREKVSEELGPELDVDWSKLDPRQYDPRRIVREALADVGPLLPTANAANAAQAEPAAAVPVAAVPVADVPVANVPAAAVPVAAVPVAAASAAQPVTAAPAGPAGFDPDAT